MLRISVSVASSDGLARVLRSQSPVMMLSVMRLLHLLNRESCHEVVCMQLTKRIEHQGLNKNVVKAFYTSGILFDVLSVFGSWVLKYPTQEICKAESCLYQLFKEWLRLLFPGHLDGEEEEGSGPSLIGNTE